MWQARYEKARLVDAWNVVERHGRQGQPRTGTQRRCKVSSGMAGTVCSGRSGLARRGLARRGMAGEASCVQDRNGVSRNGSV